MLKLRLKTIRSHPGTKINRFYCNQSNVPTMPQPTNEAEAEYLALMKEYGIAKQLQARNNFLEASEVLSRAIQKWRGKTHGESTKMALLHPLLKLAELYRSQGLDQKSYLIYDELDSMISHLIIELQHTVDIELVLDKKSELEKKIKVLRVILANTMIDCGKLYMDNEDYALAQKKMKEAVSLIKLAGQTDSHEMQFAYAMLGLLYDNVCNYEDAEWYHVEVMKNVPNLEIWNHPHFASVLNLTQLVTYSTGPSDSNLDSNPNKHDTNNQTDIKKNEIEYLKENENENTDEKEGEIIKPSLSPNKEELEQERITAEEMLSFIRKNRKMLPDQIHPTIVSLMIFVAFILRQEGTFSQSVEILSSLYDYYNERDKKAMVATMACHIGMVYAEQGDFLSAERYFKEALHTRTTVLGSSHVHTGLISADLSLLYWKQGEVYNAIHLLTSAIRIFDKQLGDSHPFTRTLKKTYHNLEEAFEKMSSEKNDVKIINKE